MLRCNQARDHIGMRNLLLIALALVSFSTLSGCGSIRISGFSDPGAGIASGTVSIVNLTWASDGSGNSITVTVVTLLQGGGSQDLTFCGSQVSQFPMNAFVTAKYKPGTTCSTLISVTVGQISGAR